MSFTDRIARRTQAALHRRAAAAVYRTVTVEPGPNPTQTNTDTNILVQISSWPLSKIDGTMIMTNDVMVIVSALDLPIPPKVGDKVIVNSKTLNVVQVIQRFAAGVAVSYTLNARS